MKSRALQPLLVALALVVTACANPIAPPLQAPPQPQDSLQSRPWLRGFTVIPPEEHTAIGHLQSEDGKMIGSAVLISSRAVLTAGHCVDGENSPQYFVTNERCYRIQKTIVHHLYKVEGIIVFDAALLILELPCSETPLQLATQMPIRYEWITTIGWGGGVKKISNPDTFWVYGILNEDPFYIRFLPIDGTIWFGDSGGAVVNSKGELVGIISSLAAFRGRIFENSAMRIDLLREWIAQTLSQN
jgi:S1-C subfamily serine protease